MKELYKYVLCAVFLYVGFLLVFLWIGSQNMIGRLMKSTMEQMDDSARRRLLEERKRLLDGTIDNSVWHKIDKLLFYSGLKWEMPFLTVELFVAFQVCMMAAAGVLGFLAWRITGAFAMPLLVLFLEAGILRLKRSGCNKTVNENLPKFLDFLGNYSVTSGEITAIFEQIARYMDKPLSDVLEECCHEASLNGDVNMALLYMREKIEHPQFKALIANIEVNMRYCADYNILVQSSRRSLRDYMKFSGERNGMLREAALNMAILIFMSFLSMFIVERLIGQSIWSILLNTLPGRVSLGLTGFIVLLFMRKVSENGK